MSTPTKKRSIWNYFDRIEPDKTFSKVKCKFCPYSIYCGKSTSILWNHLSQHKDKIIQLEANSTDSNPSVSGHNCTEKTTADNKQITQHKDESMCVEMNSSSSNPSTSSHNRAQRIAAEDSI